MPGFILEVIHSPISGAIIAIFATYLTTYQFFKYKLREPIIKDLKQAYCTADQLYRETEILLKSKYELLTNDEYRHEDHPQYNGPSSDYIFEILLDHKNRKLLEFFEPNDIRKSEELAQICGLYSSKKAAEQAAKLYRLILETNAIADKANLMDNHEIIVDHLTNISAQLNMLRSRIKQEISKASGFKF